MADFQINENEFHLEHQDEHHSDPVATHHEPPSSSFFEHESPAASHHVEPPSEYRSNEEYYEYDLDNQSHPDFDDPAGNIRRRREHEQQESRRIQTALQQMTESNLETSGDELVLSDLAPEYEEFDTIDWIRDAEYDKMDRDKYDEYYEGHKTIWNRFKRGIYRGQAWIYVVCVAILTAIFAVFIDLIIEFLADIRDGYCSRVWYFSRKVCCDAVPIDQPCEFWTEWPEAFGVENYAGGVVISYFFYCLWACVYSALACWMVVQLAPRAAGSGIPELKSVLGGFVMRSYTSIQTLVVKVFGLSLAVSSGLNLGKEGPMAHIGAATVEVFARVFPKYGLNESKKREIISAGCACGVSVAFGAPIGGVLFSLEEASYYFPHKTMWRAFFAAAVAALVLQFFNPIHTGKLVLYQVTYAHAWKWVELPLFIILGALGGAIGNFFIRINIRLNEMRKQTVMRHWPVTETVAVALITALTSFFNDYTKPGSGEMVATLFRPCPSASAQRFENLDMCIPGQEGAAIMWLTLALFTKFSLICLTYGVKVPSGLFIPALIIGALLGRIVGILISSLYHAHPLSPLFFECQGISQCIEPGVYALIGGAAVLGGFTRVTISLVVIVFELTGDPAFIIPIMMTVMMSKWVGDGMGGEGIYDELILLNELPFLDNKANYKFDSVAGTIMRAQKIVSLSHTGNTIGSLRSFVQTNLYSGFPVLADDGIFLEYISRFEIMRLIQQATEQGLSDDTPCLFTKFEIEDAQDRREFFINMQPKVDTAPIQVRPGTPLRLVLNMFRSLGLRYIIVLTEGKLQGIITKKDLLQHIALKFHKRIRTFLPSVAYAAPLRIPSAGPTPVTLNRVNPRDEMDDIMHHDPQLYEDPLHFDHSSDARSLIVPPQEEYDDDL